MGKPRNTRKYPTYPEIPESKKDTRKYPIVYFDPTRPEPNPLPGILSNTQTDPILKNPTRWPLLVTGSSRNFRDVSLLCVQALFSFLEYMFVQQFHKYFKWKFLKQHRPNVVNRGHGLCCLRGALSNTF